MSFVMIGVPRGRTTKSGARRTRRCINPPLSQGGQIQCLRRYPTSGVVMHVGGPLFGLGPRAVNNSPKKNNCDKQPADTRRPPRRICSNLVFHLIFPHSEILWTIRNHLATQPTEVLNHKLQAHPPPCSGARIIPPPDMVLSQQLGRIESQ